MGEREHDRDVGERRTGSGGGHGGFATEVLREPRRARWSLPSKRPRPSGPVLAMALLFTQRSSHCQLFVSQVYRKARESPFGSSRSMRDDGTPQAGTILGGEQPHPNRGPRQGRSSRRRLASSSNYLLNRPTERIGGSSTCREKPRKVASGTKFLRPPALLHTRPRHALADGLCLLLPMKTATVTTFFVEFALLFCACGRTPLLPPYCDLQVDPTAIDFGVVVPGNAVTRQCASAMTAARSAAWRGLPPAGIQAAGSRCRRPPRTLSPCLPAASSSWA